MKRVLICVVSVLMIILSESVYAADIASGEDLRTSATWRVDDTGTLYVSSKASAFMYWAGAPWGDYEPQIHHVIFEEGVKQIDNGIFLFPHYNDVTVTLPASLEWIGLGTENDPIDTNEKEELDLEGEGGLKKDTLFIVIPGTYAEDYVKRMGYKYSYGSAPAVPAAPTATTAPAVTAAPTATTAPAVTAAPASVHEGIGVNLNGTLIGFDQPPVMQNDRVLVPIRAIFEAMGYAVDWNEAARTATAVKGGDSIIVQLNNDVIDYTTGGVSGAYQCDVPPQLISDRILVPVRAIAESAGCTVDWDETAQTVYIKK